MAKFWEQNWFKKGAMLVGADIAGEYFFGETMPGGVSGEGPSYYSGDTFAGSFLNTVGVTPFSSTSFGSSVSGYIPDFIKQGFSDFTGGTGSASSALSAMFGKQFQQPPSMRGVKRLPTQYGRYGDFAAGQAGQIPLGQSGRVANALQTPQMRNYLAGLVRAESIPRRTVGTGTAYTGSTTLGSSKVKRTATRQKKLSLASDD